jgi:UDP-2,3-diacylglucosamine pyrophosphatase LpxH
VQKLLRLARKGAAIIYIPGNHDDRVRDFCGVHFGGVVVARDAIHQTADGRRFLVLHGDEFDGVVRHAPALALAGDLAYRIVLTLNTHLNRLRRRLGFGYWSLSAFLKSKVKNALQFIDSFEHAVADEARRRGVEGVICGHIHKAEMREIRGVAYINDGDWVESCTALVEHPDGRLEILEWATLRSWSMIERASRAETMAPAIARPVPETSPA